MGKLRFKWCSKILTTFFLLLCSDLSVGQEKIFSREEIKEILTDLSALLKEDDGKFWGKNLQGPLLLTDPSSRSFIAVEPDVHLEEKSFVLKDTLPENIPVANTAVDWQGKKWAMLLLPLPDQRTVRNELIIHELFHRIQPEIGFTSFKETTNAHLDSYDGRVLLRLELEALEKALQAQAETKKLAHIKRALGFREERQRTEEIKQAENVLELNEGVAQYTALILGGRDRKNIPPYLVKSKEEFLQNPTFVRSFAYHTVPIYGYLLSRYNPQWHRNLKGSSNLTDYFLSAFNSEFSARGIREEIIDKDEYDYKRIAKEETKRERLRKQKQRRLRKIFVSNSVLRIPLQNMQISFDPSNQIPLENLGTIYPGVKVSDKWGTLIVKDKALVASDWQSITVTEPLEVKENSISGKGWELMLKPGWKLEKIDKKYSLIEMEN